MADVENADCTNKEMQDDTETKMEEVENSESSDNSDDEEDEQISQLEKEVTDNAYLYDSHIRLIKLLRTAGELTRLQQARQKMAAVFPLTTELWIEWIEDEKKVMQESDRTHITELFERAVLDYTSVDLWLEYIQFSIGGMGEAGGMQAVRSVCERAITATGLHVSKGCLLWDAYREYENIIRQTLEPTPGSVASTGEQQQLDAQTQRVVSIFRRQLSVPLNNMQLTWEEFKDFTEEEEEKKVKPLFEKAVAKLEKLQPFEAALLAEDNLTAFEDYIDFELTNGEPARIQCIFERTLQAHCLIPHVWIRYTQYLDVELKIADVVLSVYERAVRNCTWSYQLWCGYGRAMERHERSHSQVKDVFTRALSSGFTSGLEYLTVWNAYIDYLRRRTPWQEKDAQEQNELWDTFDQAISHLTEGYGHEGDPECTLQRYKACLKAKHCGDMAAMRLTWNEIMQAGHGNKAAMWLEFFNLERAYGDHKHARKILQRALNSANDCPESVVQAYIRFERQEGPSLNDYDTAMCRCEAQMARIDDRRAKAAEKEAVADEQKKAVRKEKKAAKKAADKQNEPKTDVPDKSTSPKAPKGAPMVYTRGVATGQPMEEQPPTGIRPYKRKADNASLEDAKTDGDFKVPLQPVTNKTASNKKSKAPPPGFKAKARPPPGYKEANKDAEMDAEMEHPEKKAKVDNEAAETENKPYVVDTTKENRTIFLSNLDFKTKELQIRAVLGDVGEITDLRLVKSFSGKSKGYAYVEFVDELLVAEAIKLDRTRIEGRPMFISKCNERTNNAATFKYATTIEKNKLFVRGLPYSLTQDDIHQLFAKHGKVKEVRLVVYRSGASKGLAYVDYEAENEASQAVMKMDGHVMGEHTINVAISNPPQRKAPATTGFQPALGGGKRTTAGRGKAGTQLSLLPRSLQRPPSATGDVTNGAGDKAATKMSNQDFRAMLLKK